MRRIGAELAQPQIERLTAFLSAAHFELDFVALTQILEMDFGREGRAMKENFVAAVIGDDEAEALVFDYFLDCAEHAILRERNCAAP